MRSPLVAVCSIGQKTLPSVLADGTGPHKEHKEHLSVILDTSYQADLYSSVSSSYHYGFD